MKIDHLYYLQFILNDLKQYFIDINVSGLEECTEIILPSCGVYIELVLLFYADDTVIITKNVDSLQRALDILVYILRAR